MIWLLALLVLRYDQAGISSLGFPFNVPPQHLLPKLHPPETYTGFTSHIHTFTTHLPAIGITIRNVQFIPRHDSLHKLIVDSSLIDSTLALHTPKTHAMITNPHHRPQIQHDHPVQLSKPNHPHGSPPMSHCRYNTMEIICNII